MDYSTHKRDPRAPDSGCPCERQGGGGCLGPVICGAGKKRSSCKCPEGRCESNEQSSGLHLAPARFDEPVRVTQHLTQEFVDKIAKQGIEEPSVMGAGFYGNTGKIEYTQGPIKIGGTGGGTHPDSAALANNSAGYGKASNPKDDAARSSGRIDLSLFPDSATVYGAWAMTEGHFKYGGYNYRVAGVLASTYVAACRRHLSKWWNGEDHDPATQVHHLANAIACIGVLIDAIEVGKLNDDRPPVAAGNYAGLISRLEEKVKHLAGKFPKGPARFTRKEHE